MDRSKQRQLGELATSRTNHNVAWLVRSKLVRSKLVLGSKPELELGSKLELELGRKPELVLGSKLELAHSKLVHSSSSS